jgi:hypothetical protein
VRAALRTLVVALGLGKRFGGVTLITVDRWTIAEELWLFGEDAISRVALELSDHDIVRVWVLAGRLLEREKGSVGRRSGGTRCCGSRRRQAAPAQAQATPAASRAQSFRQDSRRAISRDRPRRGERKLPGTMALIDPRENAYTFLIDS